ncbi:hypothetical protein Gotri_018762, partial [Gossypium trilobum]|nr:hypothetical protein [Gossypium trilobum]
GFALRIAAAASQGRPTASVGALVTNYNGKGNTTSVSGMEATEECARTWRRNPREGDFGGYDARGCMLLGFRQFGVGLGLVEFWVISLGTDRLAWKWMSMDKFSSVVTYRNLYHPVCGDRLLTNGKRTRRQMSNEGHCPRCGALLESGGVFRDVNAKWLCGFSMVGFRQVELECDNALLVETLIGAGADSSKLVELRLIGCLLKRNWRIRSRHIHRTQNSDVDLMTKSTNDEVSKLLLFMEPPISLQGALHVDRIASITG